jgi:hypothetical protein
MTVSSSSTARLVNARRASLSQMLQPGHVLVFNVLVVVVRLSAVPGR